MASYQGVPQHEEEHEKKVSSRIQFHTQPVPSPQPQYGAPLLQPDVHAYGGQIEGDYLDHIYHRRYGRAEAPPQWAPMEAANGLQTQYSMIAASVQNKLARKHSFKNQFMHLLGKVLLRLLTTIILSAGMIGVFKWFENVKVLTNLEKNVFNVMSTGLYLTIGLNIAGAFKGMATMLRWKILARKAHNLEEVDLILGLSSLIKIFKLQLNAVKVRKPLVFTACFSWILLNLVARGSIALTGITYSYDSGNATATIPGVVALSDKSHFWPLGYIEDQIPPIGSQFQTAHFYGEFSGMMKDSTTPDVPFYQQILRYDEKTFEWVYNFREYNPTQSDISAETNRSVRVSASCSAYDIFEGQDGSSLEISYYNSSSGESIKLETIVQGPGATVWLNTRSDLSINSDFVCDLGPRCTRLYGFQFIDREAGEKGNGTLFDCKVNVGQVSNVVFSQHDISDKVAFIAAGAIGLDGFTMHPREWVFQRYAKDTRYGQRVDGDPDKMAILLGRFTAGVIATIDIHGPRIQTYGMKPWLGLLFKVNWAGLLGILGSICLLQLVLGLCAVIIANTVVVKDDSYLSTARLLRPLVERLGPSGCALSGKEIASTLKTSMVYGVRTDGMRHHLDLGEDILPARHFPSGWYDGLEEGMAPYRDEVGSEKGDLLL